jgi:hypothetical protein
MGLILDATGAAIGSNENIGYVNAFKTLASPLILLFRLADLRHLRLTPYESAWLAFCTYVLFADLWSPFALAGLKMSGHLVGVFLGMLSLRIAFSQGLVRPRDITAFVFFCFAVAVFQTTLFGAQAYGFEAATGRTRFTAFITPQLFACLLVALFAVGATSPELKNWKRVSLLILLLSGLYWNGSRTWMAGLLVAALIWACTSGTRRFAALAIVTAVIGAILSLMAAAGRGFGWEELANRSRLFATIHSLSVGGTGAVDVGLGTYWFRARLYQGVYQELLSASPLTIIFGHGTASGGYIAVTYLFQHYFRVALDPNRVIHNEWLRITYEWGILGLVLWFWFLISVVNYWWKRTKSHLRLSSRATLFYLPGLLIGLATENVLAGPALVCLTLCICSDTEARGTSIHEMIRSVSCRLSQWSRLSRPGIGIAR